uniref:Very-long-chain (3R)-3-hydroxyacyl-CoA dehydratase n=1 Tax=Plectus sambesii TaxID=2011161 RepID=A0A914UU45_9BILA
DPEIEVKEKSLNYQAVATGARGRKDYSFHLDFNDEVETNNRDVEVKTSGRHVEVTLTKRRMGWWPQLITGDKPHWLKIDFDKWKHPDESDSDKEEVPMTPEQQMDEMTKKLMFDFDREGKGKNTMSLDEAVNYVRYFQSTYLLVYNVALFLGHFLVVSELLFGFIVYGTDYFDSFWEQTSVRVRICTILQYFDVMHAVFGLTKSGYKAALVQISGRLAMTFIIGGNPNIHTAATTYCLLVTWFLIEIFR